MADPTEHNRPPTPRWVKVSGIIVAVLVVLVVVMALVRSGDHGPGRHAPGGSGGHTPPVQHDS